MIHYTTWEARCGCRITYKWDDEDDPKHRRHTAVSDQEHAQARLAASGRSFPQYIARKGCEAHWAEDHHEHLVKVYNHWHEAHPEYRLEWHIDGGFTNHHEPKGD
jgi:hypothetical protein